tara:strand:- start:2166 stop:2930 length:765 start_codon:yes stop_codon:yes gene_type:complete
MISLNPYKYATKELIKRLLWDSSWQSYPSRWRLKRLEGSKHGKKAVILCNGPSLLKSNLDLLREVDTFGLNKINLLFNKSDFRPSYIVAVNNHVLEQNKHFYNNTDIPLFLGWRAPKYKIKLRNNIFFQTVDNGFAESATMSIGLGSTVTYVALQLAFHMGYESVALIGCDHNFETKGPANKLVKAKNTDPNHFDPTYFSKGVKWNLPDLLNSERGYLLARKHYENNGRKIFNCTEGGKLKIFERISLENFLLN